MMLEVQSQLPAVHPQAGKRVQLARGFSKGQVFEIEDWWTRVSGGKSWRQANNPAALAYARRAGSQALPQDDRVVSGRMGGEYRLMHESELQGAKEL